MELETLKSMPEDQIKVELFGWDNALRQLRLMYKHEPFNIYIYEKLISIDRNSIRYFLAKKGRFGTTEWSIKYENDSYYFHLRSHLTIIDYKFPPNDPFIDILLYKLRLFVSK